MRVQGLQLLPGSRASSPGGVWGNAPTIGSGGHLCEAEAPTEPAGETQRPNYQ